MRRLKHIINFLFPQRCKICGAKLSLSEKHVCIYCLNGLPETYFWNNSRNPMANHFNALISESNNDEECLEYEYATALFFYKSKSKYNVIPRHLKYEGDISMGRYFSEMLANRLFNSAIFQDVDCIIPVPLHWKRKLNRGYNQAYIIAQTIANHYNNREKEVILLKDGLIRHHHTKTQTKLSIEDKKKNVAQAFIVNKKHLSFLKDKHHILLVDDIFTTGSTLNACRMALRKVLLGNIRISIATLGCTN